MSTFQTTNPFKYRLALDLGTTSLGWAMMRLKKAEDGRWEPCAIIKAGVRIFSDGRNPKDGASLAVKRREARAARRRRDRLLGRKKHLVNKLIAFGFFPNHEEERKALELLNPYRLRQEGLDRELSPGEFARALFHLNQRRGFKSNRKTDAADDNSSVLKDAIKKVRDTLKENNVRTVGEWLYQRMMAGGKVRARYNEDKIQTENGRNKVHKSYDLYIDRAMVEDEFEALWAKQKPYNPTLYCDEHKETLKHILLFQRPLKPVKPGRCFYFPEEERAAQALPSTQRFRIYQEVNNLRIMQDRFTWQTLTLEQRDKVVEALEKSAKVTFKKIKTLLKLDSRTEFNLEDRAGKREDLKGNLTSATLSKKEFFGEAWFNFDANKQDEIVHALLNEESEQKIVEWLMQNTGVDAEHAKQIANAKLVPGYGSLSQVALQKILPKLKQEVITYDEAVKQCGLGSHSQTDDFLGHDDELCDWAVNKATGEIKPAFKQLPYYGKPLQRHVGFAKENPKNDEERYGKIANPTVHIGLNQMRTVVNLLIKRYGHPTEVVVEVARELKQSKRQKDEISKKQAENQKRNSRIREDISKVLGKDPTRVNRAEIEKWILWEELDPKDCANRRCPYMGTQISPTMLFGSEVEVEHILPFSRTLDDSMNNKTVAITRANRAKGERTPWEAFGRDKELGLDYEAIIQRAACMDRKKAYRFKEDAMEKWTGENDFLARALTDTQYLSKIAHQYLRLVCPGGIRVIPGRMTAKLREKFGLNDILGLHGEKNRNDHRHHAVDACVIGVTDQGLLQRFANAHKTAQERGLDRLVKDMPEPWPNYREKIKEAVLRIKVSHRPDHDYQACMLEDTAYKPPHLSAVQKWETRGQGGKSPNEREANAPMIKIVSNNKRHQRDAQGQPLPYKGYVGGSNYCIEIFANEKGKWEGEVISTYQAYQVVKELGHEKGFARLRNPNQCLNGKPLVMRLMKHDCVSMQVTPGEPARIMQFVKAEASKKMYFSEIHEANADGRDRDKNECYNFTRKMPGSLQASNAQYLSISPIGEVRKK